MSSETMQKTWVNFQHRLSLSADVLPFLVRRVISVALLCAISGLVTCSLLLLQYSPDHRFQQQHHEPAKPVPDESPVPPKLWQILLPRTDYVEPYVIDVRRLFDTWLANNPDYAYTLIGPKGADRFVDTHFASYPRIVESFHMLKNPGLKSDLLRYLVLHVHGGVYTDTDTVALKPVDDWVPPFLRPFARLIVGIEFDQLDGAGWADIYYPLQFCQWTIAAAPGHPVFLAMVEQALDSLDRLTTKYNTTLAALKPSSFEVMNSTGPAAWTMAVFGELRKANPDLTTVRNLSGITVPAFHGDIMVLPIDGFGMGQPHSRSTNDGTTPGNALVKHMFHGSWRGD